MEIAYCEPKKKIPDLSVKKLPYNAFLRGGGISIILQNVFMPAHPCPRHLMAYVALLFTSGQFLFLFKIFEMQKDESSLHLLH